MVIFLSFWFSGSHSVKFFGIRYVRQTSWIVFLLSSPHFVFNFIRSFWARDRKKFGTTGNRFQEENERKNIDEWEYTIRTRARSKREIDSEVRRVARPWSERGTRQGAREPRRAGQRTVRREGSQTHYSALVILTHYTKWPYRGALSRIYHQPIVSFKRRPAPRSA